MTRRNLQSELTMVKVKLDQAAECATSFNPTLEAWLQETARRVDKTLAMLPAEPAKEAQ